MNSTVVKDQLVSAIVAELIFHIKLPNLEHIIYNSLSQIGENVIKISENLPSQKSLHLLIMEGQKLVKRNKQHVGGPLKSYCSFIRVNIYQVC